MLETWTGFGAFENGHRKDMAVRTPWKAAARRSPGALDGEGDRRLATLASEGDEAAFEAIFERHHRGLLTFSRHVLGSREEAEDVLQHTFTAAYRQLRDHGPPEHLRAWLYTTARNRCLSVLRARRELPQGDVSAGVAWLPEEVERRSDLRDLLSDIERLPDDQRAALVLAEIEDLDHAEVAEIVGCRPDKVRALVFQARATLGGWREARALPCRDVREEISIARGPDLRRAHLRRHLAVCRDCRAFREDVHEQRRRVAMLLPPVPIALALKTGVVQSALAGGGAATGGAAAGAGGAAAAGGGTAAGGGAAAGGAAAGGGVATAIKVGAAALVIGGAGVAGYSGLTGGDDNSEKQPSQPPPPQASQPESASTASQPAATPKANKKKEKSKSQKRLKARQANSRGGSTESVEEAPAAAPADQAAAVPEPAPEPTQPTQPAPSTQPAEPPSPPPQAPPSTFKQETPDVASGGEIEAGSP
jgi:RNA polymerase sigma factor (sigma-70 family)